MRDVTRAFKEADLDRLPGAVQRADHASDQEVRCRSALNRVQGMPFKWTLNPYRGCTHACHYCFARRYQSQLEMAPIVPGSPLIQPSSSRPSRPLPITGRRSSERPYWHLEGGTRTHFSKFLSREYPDLVEGYGRLYAGKYASPNYTSRVASILGALARYGIVTGRRLEGTMESPPGPPTPRSAQQQTLRFRGYATSRLLKNSAKWDRQIDPVVLRCSQH